MGSLLLVLLSQIIAGWGDAGYTVGMVGFDVPVYPLYWLWLALLAVVFFTGDVINGGSRHTVFFVIAGWWVCNTQAIDFLQGWWFRAVGDPGGTMVLFGEEVPALVADYIALAPIDLGALIVIWILAATRRMRVSCWMLLFCVYLVGNLAGHAWGGYSLATGADINYISSAYDSFMYLTFTAMLILQAIGAGGDALFRWSGSSVNLYADIRPIIRGFANRRLHLH